MNGAKFSEKWACTRLELCPEIAYIVSLSFFLPLCCYNVCQVHIIEIEIYIYIDHNSAAADLVVYTNLFFLLLQ